MKTKQISKDDMKDFFDGFSHTNKSRHVTVEVFGPEIGVLTEERELALEGVTAEFNNGDGVKVEIMVGAEPDDHITHNVDNPTAINVEQTDEGVDVALAIKGADGATVLLKFAQAG